MNKVRRYFIDSCKIFNAFATIADVHIEETKSVGSLPSVAKYLLYLPQSPTSIQMDTFLRYVTKV